VRNTTNDLLDEVRKINGIESDYRLAKLLNVRQPTISNYRSGRSQLSDEIAVRLAALMDRHPGYILASLAADRAKHPDVAKAWRETAKMLGRSKGGK